MAYIPFTDSEVQVDKPWGADQAQKVKGDFDYLYGQTSEKQGVFNGSFEIDSDSDGVPDGWTKNLYPGGSGAYETTDPSHGAKAYKFTHPGGASNGGGYLESDYIEITEYVLPQIDFMLKCSVAGMKNIVRLRYFDKGNAYLSQEDVYSSTSNPTAWTRKVAGGVPPATARYMKIQLISGFTDTNVAGTIMWDRVITNVALDSQTAGNYLLVENTPERTSTSTTYIKLKETKVAVSGTFRIKFSFYFDTGTTGYARIYRNGVAVGTERTSVGSPYVEYSEDIGNWNIGDLVQVYVKRTAGTSPWTVYVKDLNIYTAAPPIGGGLYNY